MSAQAFESTGAGLRSAGVGVVLFVGLLVAPPLLVLAVVVAVPVLTMSALVAALGGGHRRADPAGPAGPRAPPRGRRTLLLHRVRP